MWFTKFSARKVFFIGFWLFLSKIYSVRAYVYFENYVDWIFNWITRYGHSSSGNSISNTNEIILFSRDDDLKIAIAHKFSRRVWFYLISLRTSCVGHLKFSFFTLFLILYLLQLSALRPRTVFAFLLYKNSRNDCFGGIKCAVLKCSNASIVSAPWFTIFISHQIFFFRWLSL